MPVVKDPIEIFHNRNDRDLVVAFAICKLPNRVQRVEIVVSRDMHWKVQFFDDIGLLSVDKTSISNDGNNNLSLSRPEGSGRIPLRETADLFEALRKAVYLGPFRNAVNIGGNDRFAFVGTGIMVADWPGLANSCFALRPFQCYSHGCTFMR